MNLQPAQSAELAKSLQNRLQGDVFFDPYPCSLYSTDASIYQIQPLGVVVPRDAQEVQIALSAAAEHGLAIIPRGGGTSLSGQSIGAGLIIDFSKYMNRIVDIDPRRRIARLQPGVVLDQLNAAAARHGLQFGPDVATSSRANIGGMIGNNSAGSRSVWHGKTVDHVIELDVLLADGTQATLKPLTLAKLAQEQTRPGSLAQIYRQVAQIVNRERDEILARYPRVLRRVSGYNLDEFVPECAERLPTPRYVAEARANERLLYPDATFNLAKLIVGAEGTLATLTQALVHLIPLPAARGVVVLHFDSLAAAVSANAAILSCDPSAAELFDGEILHLAANSLEYRHYLDFVVGNPESLVLVEFSGDTQSEVEARAALLEERLKFQPGLTHMLRALDAERYKHVWACRKAALPLLLGVPGTRKPVAFVEDAAVDPLRLPDFVARFREIIARHGTSGAFYGHASVGCLHIRPMLDLATAGDIKHLEEISREVCDLVVEFGGAMSGEHGDGLARSYLNEQLFGPRLYRAFQEVKAAFDPTGRMNPGKVVNAPTPVENLRYGTSYHTLPIATTFDFSSEGGFARAVEMCNGAGVCRKTQTGTMCPSFMATGDEEHSTRGRANALRLALSGALPAEELTGQKLFDTYDLCLQCKGCKAECPSNVDVAKLKMEFLDHYYRRHGAPLGTRVMAGAARLNRLGSALAPWSNRLAALPFAGWLREKLLGMDQRRPLPTFERQHFRRWFESHLPTRALAGMPSRGPIVLLDDCLTSFCEPQVNQAATTVLQAAGYEVHLAGLECCGRTHCSKGMLGEAQRLARHNLELLLPWANRGVPIVGCEPSCLLMLLDEYPDLVPGPIARAVAARAALIDTHLMRAGIELPMVHRDEQVLLHGHCHQKALVGVHDTRQFLHQAPGTRVEVIDSGCCGMAGSFGYEHYDLSMKIGERVLLPAVRSQPHAQIIAPGFSCRQQIAHGAGRVARHPVELIAERLRNANTTS